MTARVSVVPRNCTVIQTLRRLLSTTAADAAGTSDAGPAQRPGVTHHKKMAVCYGDVAEAAYRIREGVQRTPCETNRRCSELVGCEVSFKDEFRQFTGSFKERGARNALLQLPEERRRRGVVTASAGNHALALAYHARQLGIPCTCVMPTVAPLTKVSRCDSFGAKVRQMGEHIGEARTFADTLVQSEGLTYINGFDDPAIIAGAGTMAIEILEQAPDLSAIVVPVGGGGLIAGIATVVKTLAPHVLVIGVEPTECASLTAAMEAGMPVAVPYTSTLADGLAVPKMGSNAFEITSELVDKVVSVAESSIALSVLRLLEHRSTLIEGGGAVGFAALLEPEILAELRGKKVCVPLCGSNIDISTVSRVIERGLAADGRLVRFAVTVSDRPGGIARLSSLVHGVGASFKDIHHERAWVQTDLFAVQVHCVVETTGPAHMAMLRVALEDAGYPLLWDFEHPTAPSIPFPRS